MTTSKLARLIVEPFGPRCPRCGRSGRRIPDAQVERELREFARSIVAVWITETMQLCRRGRQRLRTLIG